MIDFNKKVNHHAGRARIVSDKIVLEYMHDPKVEISISDIKLIGEYTTENGPQLDDYFIVFYYSDKSYAEISMYAENITVMISNLENKLNTELTSHLSNSAVWNSNILWPEVSNGRKLWVATKAKPESFLERIKLLFGMEKLHIELTEIANIHL